MAYLLDDDWDNHPLVSRAGTAAFGLYVRCGMWSARHGQDGHVSSQVAADYGTPEWARKLVEAGLWEPCDGGYTMPHFLARNESAAHRAARRARDARRQALVRDPALRQAIRTRDRDRCRYCGITVRWQDRKGAKGGTYDHVDPDGPTDFANLVVCCRACNAAKSNRTPELAGMVLRAAPAYLDTTQVGSRSDLDSPDPHTPLPKGRGGGAAPAKRGARAPTHGDRPLMAALPGGKPQTCPEHLFELPCRSCASERKTATCDLHPLPLPCTQCAANEQAGSG